MVKREFLRQMSIKKINFVYLYFMFQNGIFLEIID